MLGNTIWSGRKQSTEHRKKNGEVHKNPARQEALERGDTHYFTGKPCKHGHVAERFTLGGDCVECGREKNRRGYHKRLFWGARDRARKEGFPFDITAEDVLAVWPEDNCCPVFKVPFRGDRRGYPSLGLGPTLDKIRPELGYVRGNIAVISRKANLIKQDCTDPQVFYNLGEWLDCQLKK